MSNDSAPLYSISSILLTGSQGLAVMFFTGLIVMVIGFYSALRRRKEFVMIFGLSLADLFDGSGSLFFGVRGILYHVTGVAYRDIKLPIIVCAFMPNVVFWQISDISTAFMMLAINIDRYLAVSQPLEYLTRTHKYATKVVMLVFAAAAVNLLVYYGYILTVLDMRVSIWCETFEILPEKIYETGTYISAIGSVASCCVCARVWFLHRRQMQNNKVDAKQTRQQELKIKRQRRMTTTVILSSVCTLFLDAIPRVIMIYSYFGEFTVFGISSFLIGHHIWILMSVNKVANFFIYGWRHKEIRKGLRSLVQMKEMPSNLSTWN